MKESGRESRVLEKGKSWLQKSSSRWRKMGKERTGGQLGAKGPE